MNKLFYLTLLSSVIYSQNDPPVLITIGDQVIDEDCKQRRAEGASLCGANFKFERCAVCSIRSCNTGYVVVQASDCLEHLAFHSKLVQFVE